MASWTLLKRLETLWDGFQVELKGAYSVERMHPFNQYAKETNFLHALYTIIF